MTSLDHEKIEETSVPGNATVPLRNRSIDRRNVIAGLGALGIAGGFGVTRVLAQDSTPTPPTDETMRDEEIGAAYQDFLAKLAANLGEPDPTVVDTAIRDALKAMVDDKFTAGEISADLQTELKERIDTSVVPIRVGFGSSRSERSGNQKERDDDADENESEEDADSATPSLASP